MAVKFTGEESSRFVKFARIALDAALNVPVQVIGRDPLTSLQVRLAGNVIDSVDDGGSGRHKDIQTQSEVVITHFR